MTIEFLRSQHAAQVFRLANLREERDWSARLLHDMDMEIISGQSRIAELEAEIRLLEANGATPKLPPKANISATPMQQKFKVYTEDSEAQ